MEDERSGALGCGCALVPGLLLGVAVFVLVGLLAQPRPAQVAGQGTSDDTRVTVSLSEEYIGRLVSAALGGGLLEGMQADVMPGNELAVRGQASVSVLGREVGMPISFRLRVAVRDGHLELDLVSGELPVGMGGSEVQAMARPVLARLAANLQGEMERALGPGWQVDDILTDDHSVILILAQSQERP